MENKNAKAQELLTTICELANDLDWVVAFEDGPGDEHILGILVGEKEYIEKFIKKYPEKKFDVLTKKFH